MARELDYALLLKKLPTTWQVIRCSVRWKIEVGGHKTGHIRWPESPFADRRIMELREQGMENW
jgi:hypothetical protein